MKCTFMCNNIYNIGDFDGSVKLVDVHGTIKPP